MMGKYLNHYDGTCVPPGWNEWRCQMGRNNDHRYNIKNGAGEYFDPKTHNDTELFGGWATNFIRRGAVLYVPVGAPKTVLAKTGSEVRDREGSACREVVRRGIDGIGFALHDTLRFALD